MPAMLRSKASNTQLSARHTGSQVDLLDVEHPPRPSSRLSSFANFRRSSILPTLSSSNLASASSSHKKSPSHHASSHTTPTSFAQPLEKGGVDDAPTNRAPNKPPKPAALRVKKARALSISLLTPNSSKSQQSVAEGVRDDQIQARSAHSALPYTLQQALAAEDDADGRYPSRDASRQPSRSASALDLYRAHGPMKGLLSVTGHSSQRIPKSAGLGMAPNGASLAQGAGEKGTPDGLAEASGSSFLRRRRSNSFSLSSFVSSGKSANERKQGQQPITPPWKLDTARELLAGQQHHPDPQTPATPSSSHPQVASHSLLKATTHGVTASPFLNKFSVRAKIDKDSGTSARSGHTKNPDSLDSASTASSPPSPPSRIPRYKGSASHLGKADILRSTHRPSMDSISSGYQSPNGPSSPMRTNALSHSSGGRPSTSPFGSANTSPRGSYKVRTRTQSHAVQLSSPQARRVEDLMVPRHPLSSDVDAAPTMLDSKAATSQGTLPPPPRRNLLSRVSTYDALQQRSNADLHGSRPGTAMSSNTTASGPSLHHISQQIGGMGAAVGKRGWDMFKQWSATSGPNSSRKNAAMTTSLSMGTDVNAATRVWLAVLADQAERVERNGIFGRPLREAVVLTRLGGASLLSERAASNNHRHTSIAMDLGSEFKIEMADIVTSPHQVHSPLRSLAVSREVARLKYLPGVVVRCIQAIEASGLDEEGLYRLSGRSTHTAKLRQIFNTLPASIRNGKQLVNANGQGVSDLCLADVSPADMDLNSISSLLKAYLRELPHSLIPEPLGSELNSLLERECNVIAVGIAAQFGVESDAKAIKAATAAPQASKPEESVKIARLVSGPLRNLPPANWYLLRELAMHLCDLTRPDVVAQTRMPLNNLCLVLAPTLSLSVPMMHAMVAAREEMFGRIGPAADDELDKLEVNSRITRPDVSPLRSTFAPKLNPALLSPRIQDDGGSADDKRASVSTLTGKRESVSSVATVQAKPNLFSTTAPFAASYDERVSKTLLEEDDGDFASSPIAAKFSRKRNGSIAGSLTYSNFGSDSSSIRRPSATGSTPRLAQQESTTALDRGSNDHSSGPPSADGFSSAASSLAPSISSSSLSTSSALAFASDAFHSPSPTYGPLLPSGGGGAIDRPRPPTGASAKFMGGRPLGKERSGTSAHRRHSRSGSVLGIHITPDQPSDMSTPTPYHLPKHEDDEGDETVRPSPTMDKLIDDSPMNVGAVRQYWNVQGMV